MVQNNGNFSSHAFLEGFLAYEIIMIIAMVLDKTFREEVDNKMYEILNPKKYITVVKIPLSSIKKIDLVMAKQPLEKIQDCFNRLIEKPDFISNGGLFNMTTGDTVTTTVDEGKLIKDGYGSYFGLKIFKDLSFKWEAYKQNENIKDFIGASPSLIINGKIDIRNPLGASFMNGKHPRLALGSNDKYFFIVAVDGRRLTAPGMTIRELAEFMLSLGCTNAINGDGGGSLQLAQNVNGKLKYLNNPTENRKVDNFVAIYLKPESKNYPVLKKGSKGEYVKLLQSNLIKLRYDLGKWGVDGSFGAATEKAVKEFQKQNGLVVDGIVGEKTWGSLLNK